MRRPFDGIGLAQAAVVLYASLAAPCFAVVFSASCDRFEIDGNAFGAFDGTPDFVDEFDDGTLAPSWTVLLGTVTETGGDAVMHDPGTSIPLGATTLEISTIENQVHGILQGAGDFLEKSYWVTLPTTNSEFHMQLYSVSPIIEAAGLTVNNATSATQQGAPAGYSVTQSLTHGFGGSFTTIHSDTVSISVSAVTGPIVLRCAFDDATDMLTCSFSLDGGTTFQSPFPSIQIFNGGVTDYDILLGAAGFQSNSQPTSTQMLPLQLLSVKNPSDPTARRVTFKAKSPRNSGTFIVGNPTVNGATLNVKLDSVTRCFSLPASGWSRFGPTYTYVDRSGAHGPVKLAQIKQNGGGGIQNKAVILGKGGTVDIVPPNPGVQGDLDFFIGGGGEYCASTGGGTLGPNNAKNFRARNAPAPSACYVAACAP